MKYISQKSLAGIQYLGLSGISRSCLDAIVRLLQFGDKIHQARLLSSVGGSSKTHCFLLTVNYDELIVIKTGFASGYAGEGPGTLARALQLLEMHGAEIEEFEVSDDFIERVESSCVTQKDVDLIRQMDPIRPMRWYDYVYGKEIENGALLNLFPEVIPFGIIDSRIYDLALSFEAQPDNSILSAYRRLEDIVRGRTKLSESNTKLFSKAFQGENSLMYWKEVDDSGEANGRASLFNAVFMAFRNRRAHREPDQYAGGALQEFLLINQLYYLEKEAVLRPRDESVTGDK